jgi:YidC/Oxa1 family membrane protein insertase
MMILWDNFVDLLIVGLLSLSQIYQGNMGFAILTFSLMVRFALLPISLKLAYRSSLRQLKMKALQPELDLLKKRYEGKPQQLSEATLKLYKEHNIKLLDAQGLFGSLLQAPIFMGLFSAIGRGVGTGKQFFWIKDLAQSDSLLLLIVTAFTYIVSILNPNLSAQSKTLTVWIPVILTVIFLWRMSAAIGLYWAASNAVGAVQAVALRYKLRKL